MENNILDEVVKEGNSKYGLKAYGYFLMSLFCVLIFIIGLPQFGKDLTFDLYFQFELLLIIAIVIFMILGIRNSIKGEGLNEKRTNKTRIGKIGLTVFLLIFVILFFTKILPLIVEIILT